MVYKKCEPEHIPCKNIVEEEKFIKASAILAGMAVGLLINIVLRILCMGAVATTVLCLSCSVAFLNEINEYLEDKNDIDLEEMHTPKDRALIIKLEIACVVVTIASGLFAYPLIIR